MPLLLINLHLLRPLERGLYNKFRDSAVPETLHFRNCMSEEFTILSFSNICLLVWDAKQCSEGHHWLPFSSI
jgi:hypothetical protein